MKIFKNKRQKVPFNIFPRIRFLPRKLSPKLTNIKDFMGNIYTVGDAYYDNPLVTEGCYQPNRVNIDAVILKISPSIVPVELSGFLAE